MDTSWWKIGPLVFGLVVFFLPNPKVSERVPLHIEFFDLCVQLISTAFIDVTPKTALEAMKRGSHDSTILIKK